MPNIHNIPQPPLGLKIIVAICAIFLSIGTIWVIWIFMPLVSDIPFVNTLMFVVTALFLLLVEGLLLRRLLQGHIYMRQNYIVQFWISTIVLFMFLFAEPEIRIIGIIFLPPVAVATIYLTFSRSLREYIKAVHRD